jgi:hypothetical protein
MSLPPATIKIKRKLGDDPVDYLRGIMCSPLEAPMLIIFLQRFIMERERDRRCQPATSFPASQLTIALPRAHSILNLSVE